MEGTVSNSNLRGCSGCGNFGAYGRVQVRAGAADSRKELSLAEEQAILPDTGRILPAGSPEMTAEEG